MINYRPGELDQRITIKRETLTPDGMGGDTVSLSDVDTVWAKAKPMSGRESENWDQLNAAHVYLFVIRRRSDIQPDDRIVWDGVSYNLLSQNDLGGRAAYLELIAEKGVAL